MARFGFCGPTYESQSLRADAQLCRNWYPEQIESRDGASLMALYPRWGQTPFATLAGSALRGIFEFSGRLFAVGSNFAEVFSNGQIVAYSFLPVDSNPVTMAANNANQLIICTGGQLWLFPLAPGSIIYNDVALNISQIQITDNADPNVKDYYFTVSGGAPPWTVGTTLTINGVTNLPFLNGVMGTITSIAGQVVHLQLSRNLTLNFPQTIQSISTSLAGNVMSAVITLTGPCPFTAGRTVTLSGLSNVPLLNGGSFIIQSVSGSTFTITNVPYSTSTATGSPTTASQVNVPNHSSASQWTIPSPPFPTGPTWTSKWSATLFHSWEFHAKGFGFSIPASAQIVDVSVTTNFTVNPSWPQSQATSPPQLWMGLLKADAQYGTPLYESGPSAGLSGSRTLTDTSAWAPADINDAKFGGYFTWANGAENPSPFRDRTAQVISVSIAVDYIYLYSGVETGTASSELVNYGPTADTGTVTGKVASPNTAPVQVASTLGPFTSVDFVDGYFVALVSNSQNVYYSGFEDGTTWTAYFRVSKFAENVIAMLVNRSEIWLWSEKHTTVYYDTGDLKNPFAPIAGAFIEAGIAGPYCAVRADNSVFWILADERGFKVAMRAEGYTPVRVSNHAMEHKWNGFGSMSDVISYSIQHTGHVFWHMYFPSDDWSVRYDAATRMWSEISFYFNGQHRAHHSRCHALAFGKHLLGGSNTAVIYQTNESLLTDNIPGAQNNPIRRERRAPHINNELEWEFHHRLRVHLDTGTGPAAGLPGMAVGSPYLFAQDNNGNNWQITISDSGLPISSGLGPGPAAAANVLLVDLMFIPYRTMVYSLGILPTGVLYPGLVPGIYTGYQTRVPMMTLPGALQTGLSVQYGRLVIDTPQAPTREPQVMLRWSDDGGHSWSMEYLCGAGGQGDFLRRIEWRRLGRSRDRIYELSVSDPIAWPVVDAYLLTSPSNQPVERYAAQMAKMA